jgi:hypothetical protein
VSLSSEKVPTGKPSPAGSAGAPKNQQDETKAGLDHALNVSLPYVDGSIEDVSYEIQGAYFNLIIILNGRLLFSKEQIVFTTGPHLPVLDEKQIQDMEQIIKKKRRKLFIAIPYKEDSIQETTYTIADTYLHINLHGSIALSFDKSKVKFSRSPRKASVEASPTPAVKLNWLKFFESGQEIPAREQCQYSTRFPQRTTRYISFELYMNNLLYRKRKQSFQMLARYYKPDGSLLWESHAEWNVPSSMRAFTYSWGLGEDDPGWWKRGSYGLEILLNGVSVAEGSFAIV